VEPEIKKIRVCHHIESRKQVGQFRFIHRHQRNLPSNQLRKHPVVYPGSVPEFHGQGKPRQFIQKRRKIHAVCGTPIKKGCQLHQDRHQLPGLQQGSDPLPVPYHLASPLVRCHLMGKSPGELSSKPEPRRHLGPHPFQDLGFRHLVPGEIELGCGKHTGIMGQHMCRLGPRRIKPGIYPFGVGIPAGAYQDLSIVLAFFPNHKKI